MKIWTLFHVTLFDVTSWITLWRWVVVTQDEDVAPGVCCGVGGVRMLRVCGARYSQSRRHRSKVGQFNVTASGLQRVETSYRVKGTKCSIAFNSYFCDGAVMTDSDNSTRLRIVHIKRLRHRHHSDLYNPFCSSKRSKVPSVNVTVTVTESLGVNEPLVLSQCYGNYPLVRQSGFLPVATQTLSHSLHHRYQHTKKKRNSFCRFFSMMEMSDIFIVNYLFNLISSLLSKIHFILKRNALSLIMMFAF